MGDHFKILLLIVTAMLPLFLAGCNGLNVEKVPLQEADYPPEDAQPAPIGFNQIRFAVPTGTPTVSTSPKGLLGFLVCDWPYGLTEQGGIRSRGLPSDEMREVFLDTMEGLGYDVTGSPGRLFDEEEDLQRTIYSVGGRITDVKIDTCQRSNFWGIEQGRTGEGNVTVEWSVFDLLTRRNVYKITTKGYGKLRYPNYEGIELLFEDALRAAIHNLGADEKFRNLVFYGQIPESTPDTFIDPQEEPAGLYDPQEKVAIESGLSGNPAKGRLEELTKAAVLIQAGNAHGSGFFITKQGHILTNAHVVGNATRVRVVTSGKKEKLVAEVLRIDRHRDVALLRLEDIPPDLRIVTLPIRTDKPEVGEDVYAIGAPRLTQLQDTINKGIVSAHRIDRRKALPFIQADVDIYGGNSGGPLIDENGNIIGIAVLGFIVGEEALGGLNWFIPIKDALDKLNIEVRGK